MSTVSPAKPLSAELERLKTVLDELVVRYKTPAYIPPDPLSIPYRFADNPRACELVAFIAALFSYGRRDLILPAVEKILTPMDGDPLGFLENYDPKRDAKAWKGFVYRFNKADDVAVLMGHLQRVYWEYDSLENLLARSLEKSRHTETPLKTATGYFMDAFDAANAADKSYGLKFVLPHPSRGGACKRFHMFLRWMVRQDEPENQVDLGLWKKSLSPAELMIPLDTHVMQMNAALNFSPLKTNSWQAAEAITAILRRLCPEDPARYDYALFGFSLENRDKQSVRHLRLRRRYP